MTRLTWSKVSTEPDIPSQHSRKDFMNDINDQIGTVRKKPGNMQSGEEKTAVSQTESGKK